jgi:hypothetical protein
LGIFVICAALAIPFILVIYGIEGIRLFFQAWKHPDQLLQAFLYLLGIAGGGSLSLAGLASLLKKLPSVIGGPKFNLIKYLKSPDYAKQSAFIEEFHEDFTKIVDAYIGEGRVYVFIDDLDRCEHSKSADLMQAMNLMIADDPSVIFILGMDREKVAASLTVKYENVLRYLPSENSEIDADILERYSTNKGLAYGYTFIEKFIQLPFQVPQPSPENFKKFFAELGTSKNSESNKITPSQSKLNSLKSKLNAFLPFKFQRNKLPSSQYQPPNHGELSTEKTQQPAIEIKRSEIIQLSFDSDSQTVRDILMMVAPALDYNPRRIKQFINLFRLKVYIASLTGLFDQIEDSEGNVIQKPLTFEQLGKFVAINLRWPLFLLELENDPQLFKNFYNNKYNFNIGGINKDAFRSMSRMPGDESFRYWLSVSIQGG